MRVIYYVTQVAAEDEETQIRGVTYVTFNDGGSMDTQNLNRLTGLLRSMPLRSVGGHLCTDDSPKFKYVEAAVKFFVGRFFRLRVRTHYGEFFFLLRS